MYWHVPQAKKKIRFWFTCFTFQCFVLISLRSDIRVFVFSKGLGLYMFALPPSSVVSWFGSGDWGGGHDFWTLAARMEAEKDKFFTASRNRSLNKRKKQAQWRDLILNERNYSLIIRERGGKEDGGGRVNEKKDREKNEWRRERFTLPEKLAVWTN